MQGLANITDDVSAKPDPVSIVANNLVADKAERVDGSAPTGALGALTSVRKRLPLKGERNVRTTCAAVAKRLNGLYKTGQLCEQALILDVRAALTRERGMNFRRP